ncbi:MULTISPECIES: hypothetical protein [Halobacterium]|uniref:hypothetical protein n=1 Tax=Halobacterium TaxID=2239 RepID=UPI001963806B|nr:MULTISPECIES: hypothetical protein [Halobacterium]MDL0122069.1 hypothetical protein [Halobacterium salinarum]QRY25758.1 hypothetical protein JRZ79_04975 [Halobacterium sp. BOL4-2]
MSGTTRRGIIKKVGITSIGALPFSAGNVTAASGRRALKVSTPSRAGTDYEIWFTTTDINLEKEESEESISTERIHNRTYGVVSGHVASGLFSKYDKIRIPQDEFIYKVDSIGRGRTVVRDMNNGSEKDNTHGEIEITADDDTGRRMYNVKSTSSMSETYADNLDGADLISQKLAFGEIWKDGVDSYEIGGQATKVELPSDSMYTRTDTVTPASTYSNP